MKTGKKNEKKSLLPLTVDDLKRLSNLDSGIVFQKDRRFRLQLSPGVFPTTSPFFKEAVSEELESKVLKYNNGLNEMILKFTNVRICKPIFLLRTRIVNVTCISDMYVFKPRQGGIMRAVVNKTSEDHIGGLVFNVFNVSIIRPTDTPKEIWNGRTVNVNDAIQFQISKVDISDTIPYICGELISIEETRDSSSYETCSGNENYHNSNRKSAGDFSTCNLSRNELVDDGIVEQVSVKPPFVDDTLTENKKSMKKKSIRFEEDQIIEKHAVSYDDNLTRDSLVENKKSKKKKKHSENIDSVVDPSAEFHSLGFGNDNLLEEALVEKKKSKKKKHSDKIESFNCSVKLESRDSEDLPEKQRDIRVDNSANGTLTEKKKSKKKKYSDQMESFECPPIKLESYDNDLDLKTRKRKHDTDQKSSKKLKLF